MKKFEYYIEIFYYVVIFILFILELLLALTMIVCADNFCEAIPSILMILIMYKLLRCIISGKFKKGF